MSTKKVFKPVTPERAIAMAALVIASLTVVGFVTVVITLTATGADNGCGLIIDDIFPLQSPGSSRNTMSYTLIIYITNKGDGMAKNVRISAYAETDRGIVVDWKDAVLGDIASEKTVSSQLPALTLEKNLTYTVLLRIWVNDLVVLKGPGTIDLRPYSSGGGSGGSSGGGSSGGSGSGSSSGGTVGFDPKKITPQPAPGHEGAMGGGAGVSADMSAGFALFIPIAGFVLLLLLFWAVRRIRKNKYEENLQRLSNG